MGDLNILCGLQEHWVVINNAFQASDPRKFSTLDKELKLIFDLVTIALNVQASLDGSRYKLVQFGKKYSVVETSKITKQATKRKKTKRCHHCKVKKSKDIELKLCACKHARYCSRK